MEYSLNAVGCLLQEQLGSTAEFFRQIHCADPFEKGKEYVFPLIGVHDTGLYLVLSGDVFGELKEKIRMAEKIEYGCRVLRSYFVTKVPVRCVFVVEDNGKGGQRVLVFEWMLDGLCEVDVKDVDGLREVILRHVCGDGIVGSGESLELTQRLEKEQLRSSEVLLGDDGDVVSIKKGEKWVPAFGADPQKVYHLAWVGGFLGIHRFYLGLFWSGVGYLLTLGLFGVGWLFDCLKILMGNWNHNGVYLKPLDKRVLNWLKLFGVCLIVWVCFHLKGWN